MAEPRDRRELILSTAAEMFARSGLRATTVRAIADAVGVFSGSLVVTSLAVAEEQPHATAVYQNEAQYLRENPAFREIQKAAARIQQTWLQVIETGVADGTFREDIPAWVFYRLIRDALWLSIRWHRPDGPYSTGQLAEDVTFLFLHGFAAPG